MNEHQLRIEDAGDDFVVRLTINDLRRLKLSPGAVVTVIPDPAHHERVMEIAEEAMEYYKDALAELAKS